jgi:hypothetical protein
MNFRRIPADNPSTETDLQETSRSITQLVGKVYEDASPAAKGFLIEQLLRPLGIFSLVAIANGIFANLLFRGGWQSMHVRPEDIQNVRTGDVMALVDFAQKTSFEAVDGLVLAVSSSPAFAGSAAAALLVTLLINRSRSRRDGQYDDEENEGYAG